MDRTSFSGALFTALALILAMGLAYAVCTDDSDTMTSYCTSYCRAMTGDQTCSYMATSSVTPGIMNCQCYCSQILSPEGYPISDTYPSYGSINCDAPLPAGKQACSSACPSGQTQNPYPDCGCSPSDKCVGTTCDDFCLNGISYYDGECNPTTGSCDYQQRQCPSGSCNSDYTGCQEAAPVAEITLVGAEMTLSKDSIVLNGRDSVRITGKANGKNSQTGQTVPYAGKDIDLEGMIYTRMGSFDIADAGLRLVGDPIIMTDDNGNFAATLMSTRAIKKDTDLRDAQIDVTLKDTPSTVTVKALHPAPVIKSITVRDRPAVWQDSYGVIDVKVEDPDGNIRMYNITAPYGTIRMYGVDWDGYKSVTKTINTNDFEFGWKAPKLTEEMKLDFMKKMKERAKEAAWKIGTAAADKAIEHYTDAAFGPDRIGKAKTAEQEDVNLETGDIKELAESAKEGKLGEKAKDLTYKYGKSLVMGKSKLGTMYNDLKTQYDSSAKEAGEQFFEMGQAVYEGSDNTFEYMARMGVVVINVYEVADGVVTTWSKLGNLVSPFGEGDDEGLLSKTKDALKAATIGTVKDGLNWVADNYKAARAQLLTFDYAILVQVTDEDGYTASKAERIRVEGYERVIQ